MALKVYLLLTRKRESRKITLQNATGMLRLILFEPKI